MTQPTYAQIRQALGSAAGLTSESLEERLLTIFSMIASGQNPDGTAFNLVSGAAPSGAAGGDLSGTYPNPLLSATANVNSIIDDRVNQYEPKQEVSYATTAALPTNVYNNGASGVGATLTGVAFGALTVDGQAVSVGQRILVKNEAAGANNGIYVVTATGTIAAVYVLTRAADSNQSTEWKSGFLIPVAGPAGAAGTTNDASLWVSLVASSFVIGTDVLAFSEAAASGTTPTVGSAVGSSWVDITKAPYNADPTGVVDSAAGINAAYVAAGAAGLVYWPPGTYLGTSATVVITCATKCGSGVVLNTDAAIGIQIGDGTNILYESDVELPRVFAVTKDWGVAPGPGAGTIQTKRGVVVSGTRMCRIWNREIKNFSYGLKVDGGSLGAFYNDIFIGWLHNNAVNCQVGATAGGGAANSNNFYGGRYSLDSGEGTAVAGVIDIALITGAGSVPNNNIWYGGSVEGDVTQYKIKCQGPDNYWIGLRYESTNAAVLFDTSGATRNAIMGGYQSSDIVMTQTNSAVHNRRFDEMVPASIGGARKFLAGKFYVPRSSAPAGVDEAQNGMTMIPFWVPEVLAVQSLSVNVTQAAASAKVRVGIYKAGTDDRPTGAPLVDDGGATIDASTTGVKTSTTNLPITLAPGLYFLAAVYQGAAAVKLLAGGHLDPTLAMETAVAALATTAHNGYYVTGVSGALPTNPSAAATTGLAYLVAVGT